MRFEPLALPDARHAMGRNPDLPSQRTGAPALPAGWRLARFLDHPPDGGQRNRRLGPAARLVLEAVESLSVEALRTTCSRSERSRPNHEATSCCPTPSLRNRTMCARRQSRAAVVEAPTRRSNSRFSSGVTSSTEIGRAIAPSRQKSVTHGPHYVNEFIRQDTSDARDRHEEVSAGVADQPFHLTFVVALPRPSEAIVEQVVRVELAEALRSLPRAVPENLRHRQRGVVVDDATRHNQTVFASACSPFTSRQRRGMYAASRRPASVGRPVQHSAT